MSRNRWVKTYPGLLLLLLIAALVYNCGGGGGGGGGSTPIPPPATTTEQISIFMTAPTFEPSFTTNSTPVTISGNGTGDISSITWRNATTGTSGTGSGTESWTVHVPLQSGDNRIEIAAMAGGTTRVTMPLSVTYNTSVTFTSLPQLSPDAGFIGQVNVYLRIGIDDTNLDATSVKVFQVDDTGNKVLQLGTLSDDGNTGNGDEIQGDGVYSAKLSLSSSTIDLIPMRIYASNSQHAESKTSVFNFIFLDPPSDAELAAEVSTNKAAQDKFDGLVQQKIAAGASGSEAALQSLDAIAAYIAGLEGVVTVEKSDQAVTWVNETGITFVIDAGDYLENVFSGSAGIRGASPAVEYQSAGIDRIKLSALPSEVEYLRPNTGTGAVSKNSAAAVDNANKVGSMDVIHVSPYKDLSDAWAASTAWATVLKDCACLDNKVSRINATGDPVAYVGAPGTDLLNAWKQLNKYGLISTMTHGTTVHGVKTKVSSNAQKLADANFAARKAALQQKFPGKSDAWLQAWLKKYYEARIAMIHTWNDDARELFSSNISLDGSTAQWKAYRTEAQYEFLREAVQQNRIILKLKKDNATGTYYYMILITPEFISHFNQGNFPKSIWFATSCYSASSYSMANMFRSKGGLAYIGFSHTVAQNYGVSTQRTFFDSIVTGKTVGEALTAARTLHGEHDNGSPPAYLKGKGVSAAQLVFELKNPAFEDPDGAGSLDGWKIEGDARALKKLGSVVPSQGGTMAVISTGLGLTTSYGNLSQSVCVSSKAKDLVFDWIFLSEEFKEYCNRGFDDTFRVTATDNNGTTKELFRTSVDTLCGACDGNDVDSDACNNLPLNQSSVSFDKGGVWDTGWKKNQTTSIADMAGKKVTLKFYIEDKGDTIYDTAVLVDNIRITEN